MWVPGQVQEVLSSASCGEVAAAQRAAAAIPVVVELSPLVPALQTAAGVPQELGPRPQMPPCTLTQ
eukprot:3394716-Alexandrium_andersonii.AAC.1